MKVLTKKKAAKRKGLITQDEFDMAEAYSRMKEFGGTLGEHMDVVQAERIAKKKTLKKKVSKKKTVSDREFWKQIELLDWPNLRKKLIAKGLSWDDQRARLLKEKPLSYWDEIYAIASAKGQALIDRLDLGSNDFALDFSADIVGHGKKMYDRMMSDAPWARKQLASEKYGVENFSYILPSKGWVYGASDISKAELAEAYERLKKKTAKLKVTKKKTAKKKTAKKKAASRQRNPGSTAVKSSTTKSGNKVVRRFETEGGYLEVWENSPHAQGSNSVVNFEVDNTRRGQGIGSRLVDAVLAAYPGEEISAQVSSLASLKVFFNKGFTDGDYSSFGDLKKEWEYWGGSLNVRNRPASNPKRPNKRANKKTPWSARDIKGMQEFADRKLGTKKKVAKKKAARKKTPPYQLLINRCAKLWDHYCERPSKTRLKPVLEHLEKMKASASKRVADERKACLRVANKEARRLKMK